MSVTTYPQRTVVPIDLPDADQHRRDLARATNLLLAGHNNATMGFTLAIGVSSSTLIDPRISIMTAVVLVPMTADAAAESPWVTVSKGQAVIHHANNTIADRTFQVALIG